MISNENIFALNAVTRLSQILYTVLIAARKFQKTFSLKIIIVKNIIL